MRLSHLWPSPDDWRAYEAYITGALTRRFPGARVTSDVHMIGRKSGVSRQIDVLVETPDAIAFDGKCYRRKVDVKHVETFLGMLDDVGIGSGVLITTRGYTKAAIERAKNDSRSVDLQILSPDRLSEYQHVGAPLIWRGSLGVFLDCPKGWVVDTELTGVPGGYLAAMYPLGHTLDSAARLSAFMYANLLEKRADQPTLEMIATIHEASILADSPTSTFERSNLTVTDEKEVSRPAQMRTARIGTMNFGLEHSLYIDYDSHVMLLVLLSPPGQSEQMLALLTDVAKKSFVMRIEDKRTDTSA